MFAVNKSPGVIPVWRILFIIIAYVAAGHLALLLAIPPGFATAIFPPIGIALAAILLWGDSMVFSVLAGSFILNTTIAMKGGAPFDASTYSIAFEIAVGSCAAAWTGSFLIRRYLGFPNALTDEWSIFLFFVLGGPVACILSATIGAGTLCLNGIVPLSGYLYSWATWWTGDTIGVLIAAPFMLILYGTPRTLWRSRFSNVGLPLLLSSLLIVIIFFRSSQEEQQKIQKNFQIDAQSIAEKFFNDVEKHINLLTPLKGLFATSGQVNAAAFHIFCSELLKGSNGGTALSWNQLVDSKDVAEFQRGLASEGFENVRIKEFNDHQQLETAAQRDHYIVTTYIEPYGKNAKVQGFDVASNQTRNNALLLANQKAIPVMTAPLNLIQSETNQLNYLIFMPVYQTAETPKTEAMRNQLLRGYVATLIDIHTVLEKVKRQYAPELYMINVLDVTSENAPVFLYKSNRSELSPYANLLKVDINKVIGERNLRISVMPTEGYIDANRGLQSWYVLAGGLLFCSLLGGFLLLVSGRSQHIASLVEQRTLELEAILHESVEAIIILDQLGIIERVNPAACKLFNYQQNQLLHYPIIKIIPFLQNITESKRIDDNDQKLENGIWNAHETTGIGHNQHTIPIQISVSRVDFPDRFIYTCIIHDISARKKVDKLKQEFISTVSHELRTPLTSISGALGVLVGGAVPNIPAKAQDLMVIAKNNAERLGRLVNDILDIEKLEFGELQLNIAEVELNYLLNQAVVQNSGYAMKYGVHLALDNQKVVNKNIVLSVDSDRFLQVMSNLISNAVKFSHLEGIVTISISVEADDPHTNNLHSSDVQKNQTHTNQIYTNNVRISIEDHGSGIPEEFRSRVFQKFAQADSSDTRKRDGTGLGLSITRVIVERMNGKIDYVTEINKGTTFYFSLPIVRMA